MTKGVPTRMSGRGGQARPPTRGNSGSQCCLVVGVDDLEQARRIVELHMKIAEKDLSHATCSAR